MRQNPFDCQAGQSAEAYSPRGVPHGFTLVELLVVIAIIGILVALLLPAVQAARESARRSSCINNLKQLGLGAQMHVDSQGHLPVVGWGYRWIGDPDLGFGNGQPGGWHFNILPYIEQNTIRNLSQGQSKSQKRETLGRMMSLAPDVFYCPSRPRSPIGPTGPDPIINARVDGRPVETNAKVDYGINAGTIVHWMDGGPSSSSSWQNHPWQDQGSGRPYHEFATGIAVYNRPMELQMITDGTSNTLLYGEKYMDPYQYGQGEYCVDDQGLYYGMNCDDAMFGNRDRLPQQDTPDLHLEYYWGSTHASQWHAVMCDGSAHGISYDIDGLVFESICSRDEGETINSGF